MFKHTNRDLTKMDNISPHSDITSMPGSGGNRIYYYVGAIYNGTPVVLGRYYSWEQANAEGHRKLPCPFQIFPLSTGDMSVATKRVKYELLNGNNADIIMRRSRHIIEPEDNETENDENSPY